MQSIKNFPWGSSHGKIPERIKEENFGEIFEGILKFIFCSNEILKIFLRNPWIFPDNPVGISERVIEEISEKVHGMFSRGIFGVIIEESQENFQKEAPEELLN